MKEAIKKIKQCSILYVENDEETASSMLRLYKALFKNVYYANNGKDALNHFLQNNLEIDLIITDANLPQLSGLQLISQIRQDYGYKHQVIFTTDCTEDSILLKCLKLGTSDYIVKPVRHQTHLGILIKVLKPIYEKKLIYSMNQELDIYRESANNQLLVSKTNLDGMIIYANKNFCEISGYTKEELIGQPHNIVRHPNMPKSAFENLWSTIEKGRVWSGTVQNRSKDGSSYFVEANIFPIKDEENNIIEYISFRQNITEHINLNNKAKDMLKQTKLNYSKVYEDSISKARVSVSKEIENLELALNLERDNSKKQTSKRSRAEVKLNETTDEKNKEIQYWKNKLSTERNILNSLSSTNKKLTVESRKFCSSLDVINNKLSMSQNKVVELQNDKERLQKNIDDKEDVINYLEKELSKK